MSANRFSPATVDATAAFTSFAHSMASQPTSATSVTMSAASSGFSASPRPSRAPEMGGGRDALSVEGSTGAALPKSAVPGLRGTSPLALSARSELRRFRAATISARRAFVSISAGLARRNKKPRAFFKAPIDCGSVRSSLQSAAIDPLLASFIAARKAVRNASTSTKTSAAAEITRANAASCFAPSAGAAIVLLG